MLPVHPLGQLVAWAMCAVSLAACGPDSADGEIVAPTAQDVATAERLLDSADFLAELIDSSDALFDRDGSVPLNEAEKAELLAIYAPLADYLTGMDVIRARFRSGARAYTEGEAPERKDSVALTYAMHAGSYRVALAFVARASGKPMLEKLLDEAHPAFGLEEGLFSQIQARVLDKDSPFHLERFEERHLEPAFPELTWHPSRDQDAFLKLARRARRYRPIIEEIIESSGLQLFVIHRWETFEDAVFDAILPIQTAVASWMGDTTYYGDHLPLVSREQVDALAARMEPGDVIIARRNWYLSNVGLPGFWPHAALFVGTPEQLTTTFDSDPMVRQAYPHGFAHALAERYPEAWETHATSQAVVLEAISTGVVWSTQYEGMQADYVAVMRPRLTKLERARAIERAYARFGTAYDFEFDFATDGVLVCTELVYKAFRAPAGEGRSLDFPLESIAGRVTLPANRMVEQFDAEARTENAQLDFVGFLDGRERDGVAVEADEDAFRQSWTRPRWDWSQH